MIRRIALTFIAALSLPAAAGDFGSLATLSQDEFRRLSQDLGAVISYKGVTPATPLGTLGFDVGLEVTRTRIENPSVFRRAGAGVSSDIDVPKLHVYKGLPFGLDIGAFVGGASDIGATLMGVDLRYAFLDDGLTTPALALRLSGFSYRHRRARRDGVEEIRAGDALWGRRRGSRAIAGARERARRRDLQQGPGLRRREREPAGGEPGPRSRKDGRRHLDLGEDRLAILKSHKTTYGGVSP
jgi:hypothetical protein